MTPDSLYDLLVAKCPVKETIVCDIHSACRRQYQCACCSKHLVLDFDAIKTDFDRLFHKKHKSVDAVTLSGSQNKFCFIELKSWNLLLTYNSNKEQTAIHKQARKYESSLPDKLYDSMDICKELSSDPDLFGSVSAVYILVTDIDVCHQPLESLVSNLNVLAGTSSDWIALCNTLSRGIMSNIKRVSTYYEHCEKLDILLATI